VKKKLMKCLLAGVLVVINFTVHAQHAIRDTLPFPIDSVLGIVDRSVVAHQHYIRFSKNKIDVPGDPHDLMRFYEKFDSLTKFQDRQLVIYHFGGSHIQADIYSNRVRNYLQTFDTCMVGPRGWVFPFGAVHTNSPTNYKVEYTGKWSGVRSPIKKDAAKTLGLMGISATTKDSSATIKIFRREDAPRPYDYIRLRIYYNLDSTNYVVQLRDTAHIEKTVYDRAGGFVEFNLSIPRDTVDLIVVRSTGDTSRTFTLYGIQVMNNEPGIIYNSIGVNGAAFDSYQRCTLFQEQLAQLPPDLVIISIGTNDANDADFSPKKFADNYIQFVETIRKINPHCSFIFTVPNDNYYKLRYPQKNIAKCKAVIYSVATKYNAGVWDFYDIMGGYGSSQKWYRAQLMKRDRIHFTYEGYLIKGDLFYEAFLKWYTEFTYLHARGLGN